MGPGGLWPTSGGKGQRSEAHSLIIIILNYSSFWATFSFILRKGPIKCFPGHWRAMTQPRPAHCIPFPFHLNHSILMTQRGAQGVATHREKHPALYSTVMFMYHTLSSAEEPAALQDVPRRVQKRSSRHSLCHQTKQSVYKFLFLET